MANTATKWILIIEDNSECAKTIKDVLESSNLRALCAYKAHDAMIKLRNQKFDLILLDLHLPDSNGRSVIDTIRGKSQELNYSTPIIITSGFIDKDSVTYLAKHVQGFMVKPFAATALVQKIKEYLSSSYSLQELSRMNSHPSYPDGNMTENNFDFPEVNTSKNQRTFLHDLSTPLTILLTLSDQVLHNLETHPELYESFEKTKTISDAVHKIKTLIEQRRELILKSGEQKSQQQ